MRDVLVEYYPYKVYRFCYPVSAVIVLLGLLGIVCFGGRKDVANVVCWIVYTILFGLMTKYAYNLAKVTIYFETRGIRIINDRNQKNSYYLYENYSNVYYCRDYRGHLFLLFSAKELSRKQQKQIVNRSSLFEKVYVGDVVVIYLKEYNEEGEKIKEMVSQISFSSK